MSVTGSLTVSRIRAGFRARPGDPTTRRDSRPRGIAWAGVAALAAAFLLLLSPMTLLALAGVLAVAGVVGLIARWAALDWAGALLLLFLLLMTAFGRDFSYVHVQLGDVSLYVTEVCLAILLPALIWRGSRRHPGAAGAARVPLAFLGSYVLIGLARLPHDIGRFGLEALRDAVLVYYALFGLLAMAFLRTWTSLRCLFLMVWAGSLIATLLICWNAVTGQGVETSTVGVVRYGAGIQALSTAFALIGGLSLFLSGAVRHWRGTVALMLLGQLLVAVFLVQHRSLLLATAAGIGALLLLHPERRRVRNLGLAAYLAVSVLMLLLVQGAIRPPRESFLRATVERAATSVDPAADTNTRWRMGINLSLLRSTVNQPFLGVGFGEPISFRYGPFEYVDVDPHNSFVAIVYRLGLPAACFLLVGILLVIRQTVRAIRHGSTDAGSLLPACLASFLAIAVFACFNVVLEGPYMGIFFWLLLGILLRFAAYEVAAPRLS